MWPAIILKSALASTALAPTGPASSRNTPDAQALLVVESVCFGGRVAVDRRDVARLPMAPVTLGAGFHLVEVLCPGRARWSRLVFLPANVTTRLAATPREDPASGRGAPRPADPASEHEAPRPEDPPAPDTTTRFELSGRAGLAARLGASPENGRATALEQSWALEYGAPDEDAWRATFRPRARHGVTGPDRTTTWAVDELRLRTDRWGGVAVAAGRWQGVFPGRLAETREGALVDLRAGPWHAAATGAWALERETPLGGLSGGFSSPEAVGGAQFEVGDDGLRAAISAGGPVGNPWRWFVQAANSGASPHSVQGLVAHASDDSRLRLQMHGQWRAAALGAGQFLLTSPRAMLADLEGAQVTATASVRVPQAERPPLEGHVEGAAGQTGWWIGGSLGRGFSPPEGVRGRTWRSAVAVDYLWRPEDASSRTHRIQTWSRLNAVVEGQPATRWRCALRTGPERLVFSGAPGAGGVDAGALGLAGGQVPDALQFFGGRATAGFALDPGVWLRAEVGHGALDPAMTPNRGRATTAFVGLELW